MTDKILFTQREVTYRLIEDSFLIMDSTCAYLKTLTRGAQK